MRALSIALLASSTTLAQTPPRTTVAGSADFTEQASSPAVRANHGRLFTKVDGRLYYLKDDGTEYDVLSGGGGVMTGEEILDAIDEIAGALSIGAACTTIDLGTGADGTGCTLDCATGELTCATEIGGSMTGAEILAALLTVDGAGSLLDADTLDALSSSAFCQVTGGANCTLADSGIVFSGTTTSSTTIAVATSPFSGTQVLNIGGDRTIEAPGLRLIGNSTTGATTGGGSLHFIKGDTSSTNILTFTRRAAPSSTVLGGLALMAKVGANEDGVRWDGPGVSSNTDSASIALHGDASATPGTVHLGRYATNGNASHPLVCMSYDVEELSSNANPVACFWGSNGVAALMRVGQNDVGTDTDYSQAGIDRASAGAETYNIQNSGAGAMTLQVDGVAVWTATNDGTGSGLDADTIDGVNEAALCLIDGTRSFTGAITTSGDLAVNGDDITCDSATCTLFATNATAVQIGAAATTTDINGGTASTGVTFTNGSAQMTNLTLTGAIDVQSVLRNTAGANLEIDEAAIRGTAALTITTQNNGDVILGPGGSGDVVLTPGTAGRVELNTVTVTALASTLCDADAEVGHMYRVSANAAADIALCVCGKAGSAYSFFPLVASGDCTP